MLFLHLLLQLVDLFGQEQHLSSKSVVLFNTPTGKGFQIPVANAAYNSDVIPYKGDLAGWQNVTEVFPLFYSCICALNNPSLLLNDLYWLHL